MSSGRTINDVLMGAARRAAQKRSNPKPSSNSSPSPSPNPSQAEPRPENPSSPKKPKTLDPTEKPKDLSRELKKKCSDFNPRSAATWKDGDPVPFLFLARALELISNESGRIVITEILANVFRTVMATTPGDLLATVYLSANRIAAPHEGIELGIGDASLIKALAEAYGRREEQVKKQLKVNVDVFLFLNMHILLGLNEDGVLECCLMTGIGGFRACCESEQVFAEGYVQASATDNC